MLEWRSKEQKEDFKPEDCNPQVAPLTQFLEIVDKSMTNPKTLREGGRKIKFA